MRKLLVLGVTAALVLPLSAAADGHRKPGLWQITSQTSFTKGGPQMPQLTPDQLAKMQAAGVKMPAMMGGGGPQTMQICLTPEQAAQDQISPGRGDCQVQNQSWSSSTFSADLVCHGPQGDMHGHFQAVISSDTSYTSTAQIEGNNPHMGGDFVMEVHGTSQWQGADCGSVKPFTRPN